MKKASVLILVFIAFIYRITIGQTLEMPVFKNAEGLVTKCAPASCSGEQTGFLGVMPVEKPEIPYGLSVEIIENGPAAMAGLKGETLILSIDDKPVASWDDLVSILKTTRPGQKVAVEMGEGESLRTVSVELGRQRQMRTFHRNVDEPTRIHRRMEEDYPKKPACLGVFGQTGWAETNLPEGTEVTNLVKTGAAEKVGIAIGDILTSVDGVPVETFNKLHKTIAEYQPGDRVKVDFLRGEKRFSVEATLQACEQMLAASKTVVVKWADAIKPQPIENQPVVPQNKLTLESFTAFPNPVSDEVTIRFSGEKMPVEINLVTASGQVLFSEIMERFDGQYEQQFDLRDLPKGLVIFSVKQNGKVFSEEILVQ